MQVGLNTPKPLIEGRFSSIGEEIAADGGFQVGVRFRARFCLPRLSLKNSLMLAYPKFDPVLISIGSLRIHWYGIMYLAAFLAAWWLGRRRAAQPNSNWSAAQVDDLLFYGMVGVILGGRIGYVLFYGFSYWRADWLYPFKIWEGGMSFHGGLLGVIASCAILAARQHRHVGDVFDFAAPLVGPGIFFVRLGNFINGELWGKPTRVPWAVVYEGVPRHASQIYEGVLEGLVLGTALWLFSSTKRPRLATSGVFLIGYGVIRSTLEFVRVPDANRGYLLADWLTEGQLLSAPMIAAGLILFIYAYRWNAGGSGPRVAPEDASSSP